MPQEATHPITLEVFRETFVFAMLDAIEHLEAKEKEMGYTMPSARLATYRMMKETCQEDGHIIFREWVSQ